MEASCRQPIRQNSTPYPCCLKGPEQHTPLPTPIRGTYLHRETMCLCLYIHIHCHIYDSREKRRRSPRRNLHSSGKHVSCTNIYHTTTNTHIDNSSIKHIYGRQKQTWSGTVVSCRTVQSSQADPHPSNQEGIICYMAQLNNLPN